jgi:hypothetical protein
MITLPALSIRQPWAWAIVHAGKDIENRDWSTRFRGRFLIHAGLYVPDEYDAEDLLDASGLGPSERAELAIAAFQSSLMRDRGGIVGVAEIVDCVTASTSPWFAGRFGFVLRNARPLPFYPCKGRLGFFDVDYPYEVAA